MTREAGVPGWCLKAQLRGSRFGWAHGLLFVTAGAGGNQQQEAAEAWPRRQARRKEGRQEGCQKGEEGSQEGEHQELRSQSYPRRALVSHQTLIRRRCSPLHNACCQSSPRLEQGDDMSLNTVRS
jgi:hypothetical protein